MNKQCTECKHGSREEALAMTRLEVAQYGTVNIGVPSDSANNAPFTYSIGLMEHFNHPEIIITGLRTDLAHFFLNTFREFIKDGNCIEPEKIYKDFSVGNLPLIFKIVSTVHYAEYLGYGIDYYRQFEPLLFKKFSAYQMVWSDKQGLFPWEIHYGFPAAAQPLLYVSEKRRAEIY